MNAKTVARFAVVGCALLAASAVLATETFRKLSGSQIHARLARMEVTDEVHWRDYYLRDGSFKSRSMSLTGSGNGGSRIVNFASILETRPIAVAMRFGVQGQRWS
jgi:hypothetical protein